MSQDPPRFLLKNNMVFSRASKKRKVVSPQKLIASFSKFRVSRFRIMLLMTTPGENMLVFKLHKVRRSQWVCLPPEIRLISGCHITMPWMKIWGSQKWTTNLNKQKHNVLIDICQELKTKVKVYVSLMAVCFSHNQVWLLASMRAYPEKCLKWTK